MRESGSVDLDEAFNQARSFSDSGKLTDAHLLYFYAAREGHPASATQLAQMYDPTRYSSATSIMDEPDPGQAYKWYRRAADAGDRTAQQMLTELRRWVEQAAKGGDVEAEQLLLGWK
jgi:TPR repeat protein